MTSSMTGGATPRSPGRTTMHDAIYEARPSPAVRIRTWSQTGRAHAYPRGAHAPVEIAIVEQGSLEYRVGSQQLRLGPGQAGHLMGGAEHQTTIAQGTRATSLWIDAERAHALGAALGTRPAGAIARLEHAEGMRAMAATLVQESKAGGGGLAMLSDAIVDALLTLVHRQGPHAQANTSLDSRVSTAMDFVQDNYAEGISVDDIAHSAGISRFHFSRMFREQTRMSPYQYLTETRLRRAAELLSGGRYSVTEAALSVGFTDLGRFSRAFRGRFGLTPSAWLQAQSEAKHPTAQSA